MSRIGKKPVPIPQGVEVEIENQKVSIKGKLGKMERAFHPAVKIDREGGGLTVSLRGSNRQGAGALWGLSRSLLSNMVVGVSRGFVKKLEIHGVGYRAAANGRTLQLNLGFSHPIDYALPEGVEAQVEKNTFVTISGMDPELIGQACAEIRAFRPPEPYKGKGIRYSGEAILRKEGKKK